MFSVLYTNNVARDHWAFQHRIDILGSLVSNTLKRVWTLVKKKALHQRKLLKTEHFTFDQNIPVLSALLILAYALVGTCTVSWVSGTHPRLLVSQLLSFENQILQFHPWLLRPHNSSTQKQLFLFESCYILLNTCWFGYKQWPVVVLEGVASSELSQTLSLASKLGCGRQTVKLSTVDGSQSTLKHALSRNVPIHMYTRTYSVLIDKKDQKSIRPSGNKPGTCLCFRRFSLEKARKATATLELINQYKNPIQIKHTQTFLPLASTSSTASPLESRNWWCCHILPICGLGTSVPVATALFAQRSFTPLT